MFVVRKAGVKGRLYRLWYKLNQKTNKEAKREQKEVQKEKVTSERTVLLLKKIIGNQKKRAAKDKKKVAETVEAVEAAVKFKMQQTLCMSTCTLGRAMSLRLRSKCTKKRNYDAKD